MWTILKVSIEFVIILLLFFLDVLGFVLYEAHGLSAPPDRESNADALQRRQNFNHGTAR